MANQVTIVEIKAESNRRVRVRWSWDRNGDTDHYKLRWHESWGAGYAISNDYTEEASSTDWVYTYSVQEEYTTKVSVDITPIAKKDKNSNGTEVARFTAQGVNSGVVYLNSDSEVVPAVPNTPSVSINEEGLLLVTVTGIDELAEYIEIDVAQDNVSGYKKATPTVDDTDSIRYTCKIDPGHRYQAQARAINNAGKSNWSAWSNEVGSGPATPKISTCKAESSTSVRLEWNGVDQATGYVVEYTTKKEYFDATSGEVSSESVTATYCIINELSGGEYFFRLKATNNNGESGWSSIVSIKIGEKPSPPTTWSSTTSIMIDSTVTLYWTHNSEDGSDQESAKIYLTIGNDEEGYISEEIRKEYNGEENKDDVYSYIIPANTYSDKYPDGYTIKWKICTKGAFDNSTPNNEDDDYSDYSTERVIEVYGPPELNMILQDSSGTEINSLLAFPLYINLASGPNTQKPVGYSVSITSDSAYETIDHMGNKEYITAGKEVFLKNYDTSNYEFLVEISANNIDLQSGISYTVKAMVSMDSGLTAEATASFTVDWSEEMYEPNAKIGYDPNTITTIINPYCVDDSNALVEGALLSVYRRNFDGTFTEIAANIQNDGITFVTDPHPSLDYARYRIVVKSSETGAINFYDMPGYEVGEKAVIIQWDETWSYFLDSLDDSNTPIEEPNWTGSMLKLPYNIDISDSNSQDVSLVEYIGRKYPVSYYGTQLGEKSTWSMEIPKSDRETLYGLRKLSKWMGNVYVREPYGSGYWANVSVSFSQKHCAVTIPITLNIIRVEGDE